MKIPLVDLSLAHREVADEVASGLQRVIAEGSFILGPAVAEFEQAFADFCGARYCVGVGNGTDALELILRGLEIGAGDEVLVPANTFIASALAVVRAGATPVLVDCEPVHQLMDVGAAKQLIGSRTRAILGVDLFGQIAPFEELEGIAGEHGVLLLEDAAQAQGARRMGRCAGCWGVAAGTSFYPAKNLGAYGDAGAVLTDDDELAARVRCLRNYGSDRKYHHLEQGFNSRLDSVQAVVLLAKLARLSRWNDARDQAARRYHAMLADLEDIVLPAAAQGNEHVWHLYVVRVPERDRVLEELHAAEIGAAVHYPVPIHLQGAFAHLGYGPGTFPEAERAAREVLSLPLYPGITEAQQERVVEVLSAALKRG